MENELYDNLKALNADVDDLVETVEKIPAFVVKKVKESEEKTIKNLKKLDEKISKVKTIQGKQGEKGDTVNGKDGYTPIKGLDYFDGKDGSPDTPTEIKTKLESLQGDDRLDASAIKGSENALTNEHFNEILKAVSSINNVRTAMVNAAERGIQSVVTNATLTGSGTASSPLGVVGGSPIDDTQIAVRVATTAALAGSPVYANGSSGVGATLTRGTNGVLPAQDGVSLEVGDRILVKNQATTLQNGIYEVTSLGSASTKWVLTRTTDADSSQELDEMIVAASEGTTNRAISYGQQTNNPTIGTSAITFTAAPSVALSQATTGTQVINQIPLYTGTARRVTRGTSALTFDPVTNAMTVGGIATFTSGGISTLSTDIPKTVKVSVSSAEILALNSIPKQLVAAPGAGKYIQIISAQFSLTYGSVDYSYSISQSDVTLTYGTSQCSGRITLNSSSTVLNTVALSGTYGVLTNTAVNFYCSTGNPTSGDSTVDIYLVYRIVTL